MALADTPAAPKAVWRRKNVLSLLIIAFVAELGYAVLNISTMPVYLTENRGFGEFGWSMVLLAFLLSEAIFKGPMGHLSDHFGKKNLMMVAPLLTVVTSLTSLVVPHMNGALPEVLIFATLRGIDGIGAAMLWPAAYAASGEAVDDTERQQAMSLLNACYFIGVALALPLGGIVEDFISPSASLILVALLFAGVSLSVWRLMRADRPHDVADEDNPAAEGFNLMQFVQVARRIPQYLTLAIVTFAGIGFTIPIIKLFARDEFQMTNSQFGFFIVLPGALTMVFLSVPMAKLGERLGRAKAVHLGLGLCAAGISFVALGAFLPWLRAPWALAIGGIPCGVGFLLAIPAWMASVSDIDPRRRAANLGAVMTAQGIGAIIGAPLGGLSYERLKFISLSFAHYSPFLWCAICVTAGWLISLRILRAQPAPAEA